MHPPLCVQPHCPAAIHRPSCNATLQHALCTSVYVSHAMYVSIQSASSIHMSICMLIYTSVYTSIYIHVFDCACMHVYIYTQVHACICTCVCMHMLWCECTSTSLMGWKPLCDQYISRMFTIDMKSAATPSASLQAAHTHRV